ncbi:MAG: hypothetical protein ABR998_07790 [Gemmatimonadales bacterium]|jgi:hypothetical protein
MKRAKRPPTRHRGAHKRPYVTPGLTVHGDIGVLTQTKKGHFSDGTKKPVTRASGGNA